MGETTNRQDPSRGSRLSSVLVVVMMLFLVVPPLLQAVFELLGSSRVYALELFRTPPATDRLRAFESELEDRSWLVRWARRPYAQVIDGWTLRGSERVVFGRDDWLFHRQSVDFVTAPAFDTARSRRAHSSRADSAGDPLAVIVDFRDQLRARNIELLVVPVPVKATLHPEKIWQRAPSGATPNNPGVERFLASLRQKGVPVVDVTSVLLDLKRKGTAVYQSRDTHWSPAGMYAAARSVVDRVKKLPVYEEMGASPVEFDHRKVVFEGAGDIPGMLAYASWDAPFEPMTFELRQVIATADGRTPLGGGRSPILLLGDSLTNVYSSDELRMGRRGGFAEQLADGLGMPIDVIASPGGGATRSRQSLVLRPGGLDGKRLVIWQFSQRDLLFSRDGWIVVDLESSVPAARADSVPSELATVARVSDVTDTSESPDYADCLMIVEYEVVDGDRPPGDDGNFFVAYWGWQNWERTEAAEFRRGDVHTLSLTSLHRELNLENTCWVDSVGLTAQPWLAE